MYATPPDAPVAEATIPTITCQKIVVMLVKKRYKRYTSSVIVVLCHPFSDFVSYTKLYILIEMLKFRASDPRIVQVQLFVWFLNFFLNNCFGFPTIY